MHLSVFTSALFKIAAIESCDKTILSRKAYVEMELTQMGKQKNAPLGTQGERNQQQYQMDLPPVNFKKNNNVVSNPYVDDLKTKR